MIFCCFLILWQVFVPIFRVYSSLALALKSFFSDRCRPDIGLIFNLSRAVHAGQRAWQRQDSVSIRPRCSGQIRSILTAHVQLVMQLVDRSNTTPIGQDKKTLTFKALLL